MSHQSHILHFVCNKSDNGEKCDNCCDICGYYSVLSTFMPDIVPNSQHCLYFVTCEFSINTGILFYFSIIIYTLINIFTRPAFHPNALCGVQEVRD